MGNMSNPSVNRWGINTFWYSFWYSDTKYAENLKQDSLFIKLINIYLFFGLNISQNVFANFYWYSKQFTLLKLPAYSRQFVVKNNLLQTQSSYQLRQKTENVYPMKLWLLKYNNWIVINLYWFQPFKKKASLNKTQTLNTVDLFSISNPQSNFTISKLKTIFTNHFFLSLQSKNYYQF